MPVRPPDHKRLLTVSISALARISLQTRCQCVRSSHDSGCRLLGGCGDKTQREDHAAVGRSSGDEKLGGITLEAMPHFEILPAASNRFSARLNYQGERLTRRRVGGLPRRPPCARRDRVGP
jgi:hypothetical protein